jgi:hypothetical protein
VYGLIRFRRNGLVNRVFIVCERLDGLIADALNSSDAAHELVEFYRRV